jgi:hypothetical protein
MKAGKYEYEKVRLDVNMCTVVVQVTAKYLPESDKKY